MRRVVLSGAVSVVLAFAIACSSGEDAAETGESAADDAALLSVAPPPPSAVPLTITMPPKSEPGPIDSVRVTWEGVVDSVVYGREDLRTQYRVGEVPPDSFKVEYWLGGPNPHPQSPEVSFEAVSECEGTITRIACAVVQRQGADRVVCAATYDGMDDPPEICEGTYACIKCPDRSRVCSSNPVCVD